MDVAEQPIDAWRINSRINHFVLDGLTGDQPGASLAKGKAVAG